MTIHTEYTPPDLVKRMQQYPDQQDKELRQAHRDALAAIHENVPPYPAKPAGSTYIRTGDLGAGLGSGFGGGIQGTASIYSTKPLGQAAFESEFGSSRPSYNEFVIGEETQAAHMKHWWRISEPLRRATAKIVEVFDEATERLAKFLGG